MLFWTASMDNGRRNIDINVDHVPLLFVVEQDKLYDSLGTKQVWVSKPGSGLDGRQA